MHPTAPFRLTLLRTFGPRKLLAMPFHPRAALSLSFPFSTHPLRSKEHQPPTSHKQSYFQRVDSSIAKTFGIGRNMRIVLYVIGGVVSAIETWFYCFWAWQWWKRRGEEGHEIEDAEVRR
ncbi:hypothetical protein B0H17DRAFT_514389 [Mycena rosella]|uniref:Uncharacterized protein n=1 Tax=Mycena rosella TaxID=1033263 RepID=A0AAD7BWS0_MYCRO|nr:hypothetical protein B0H17DRAFT_514389 [Mycena rosella]